MNQEARPAVRVTGHLVFGFFIILIGILFTLDNLDIVNAEDYMRYWPAVLIAVGAARLAESRSRGEGSLPGGIFVGVGTWLLLINLGIWEVRLRELWPLLLVALGGIIVWQGMRGRRDRVAVGGHDTISAIAVMSGIKRGSNSRHFRGGELTAVMGGCEIDLRKATIEGEAVIDVFAMWGGIDIRVPEEWTVVGRVTPMLGGFEDQTRASQTGNPQKLIVRGLVIMGGIEIKN